MWKKFQRECKEKLVAPINGQYFIERTLENDASFVIETACSLLRSVIYMSGNFQEIEKTFFSIRPWLRNYFCTQPETIQLRLLIFAISSCRCQTLEKVYLFCCRDFQKAQLQELMRKTLKTSLRVCDEFSRVDSLVFQLQTKGFVSALENGATSEQKKKECYATACFKRLLTRHAKKLIFLDMSEPYEAVKVKAFLKTGFGRMQPVLWYAQSFMTHVQSFSAVNWEMQNPIYARYLTWKEILGTYLLVLQWKQFGKFSSTLKTESYFLCHERNANFQFC